MTNDEIIVGIVILFTIAWTSVFAYYIWAMNRPTLLQQKLPKEKK